MNGKWWLGMPQSKPEKTECGLHHCLPCLPYPGLYTYRNISLVPNDISNDTDVIAIVITRWNSVEKRKKIRDMFYSGARKTLKLNYKIIFLFNLPEGE